MTCYYCIYNVEDEEGTFVRCKLDVDGYPLPFEVDCRHFWFDTGEEKEE